MDALLSSPALSALTVADDRRTIDALIAAARVDFAAFIVLMFSELHDGAQMKPAPYIDVIAELMMSVHRGRFRRVVVNLPPGHMKSMLISVLYTAWVLGVNPSKRILCISYGDELALHLSRLTRRAMLSPTYKRIFPGTILAKQTENLLTTTRGGQRFATAVGGSIAGFRGDLAVIDDPMQPNDVASEVAKQKLRDFYDGVVEQRMVPGAAIMVVMHRLAPDDFTATLVEKGGWLQVSLPLIAIVNATYKNRNGEVIWRREAGELLSPGWTTSEAVDDLRRLPSEVFETQYQENPQFGGTGACSVDRFKRYDEPSHYELYVHSWDLAATRNGGDWTVCAKFGLTKDEKGREVFDLVGIFRTRVELPDVRELIRAQDIQDKPALIIVDGVGIGLGIVQELQREMSHLVSGYTLMDQNVTGLKTRRFFASLPPMYDGLVRLPKSMDGLQVLLNEFAAFPNGRHDDQVDAVGNVAADRQLVIRMARQHGAPIGRLSPFPSTAAPPVPKSRDQELHDRRNRYSERD